MADFKKLMTATDFINRLKHCIFNLNTSYNNQKGYNCGYKHQGGYYTWDCWNWFKTIWWGWVPGYNTGSYLLAPGQNGIGDWNGRQILNNCYDVSTDFTKLSTPASYLLTKAEDHAGVFIGKTTYGGYEFNVAECTPQTDVMIGGCLLSYVDEQGRRFNHKGGQQAGAWHYHAKMPWIDYMEETPNLKFTVTDISNGKAVVSISGTTIVDVK
jgi:hypothetical protein